MAAPRQELSKLSGTTTSRSKTSAIICRHRPERAKPPVALIVRVGFDFLISGLLLLCGYFIAELRHYRILSNRLLHDRDEWGRQWYFVIVCLLLALGIWLAF